MIKESLGFRVFASIVIISGVLVISIQGDIKDSQQYFKLLFEQFSNELQIVGNTNVQNAREAQEIINNVDELNSNFLDVSKIHYYPVRNEYGFNQGVFPSVSANGTLIGYGRPPQDVIKNSHYFQVYDKIWNSYRESTLFSNHFVANYKYDYIYSSKIHSAEIRDSFLNENSITPDYYRVGLGDSYISDIKKYGYFFSLPFINRVDNKLVITVLSPLFFLGEHIADMGTDIVVDTLKSTLFVYPEVKEVVSVDVSLHHSNMLISISQGKHNKLEVFKYEYDIPNFGLIVAHYDLFFFLKRETPLFLILVLLAVLINSYISSLKKHREEKYQLNQQVTMDPMTHLYNRRVLDSEVETALLQQQSKNLPISMISIDVDDFKKVNDKYGHHVGDEALLFIAKTIRNCTRQSDFCIRMGGDEFLIIQPGVNLQVARQVAKRIEQQIEKSSSDSLGLLVGVTTAVTNIEHNESFDDAYKRIDTELYSQKGIKLPVTT